MSEWALIACGLASEPMQLPGRVVACASCGVEVFLTDNTREHVERTVGAWKAKCITCATLDEPGPPRWEMTPLGHALADAQRRRQ